MTCCELRRTPCPPMLGRIPSRTTSKNAGGFRPPSQTSTSENFTTLADTLIGSLLVEHGVRSAVPPAMLSSVCAMCGISPSEVQEVAVRAESRQQLASSILQHALQRPQSAGRHLLNRRLHYVPKAAAVSPSPSPSHGNVKNAARNPTRPPIMHSPRRHSQHAPRLSPALFALEMQRIRRHLRSIAARVPALEKFREQKELNIVNDEEGQLEFFDEVFSMMDASGRGSVDEEDFVVFGQRVGGDLHLVLSRGIFREMLAARKAADAERAKFLHDVPRLTREDLRSVIFPSAVATRMKRNQQQKQLDEQRQASTAAALAMAAKAVNSSNWEEEGNWLPSEAQLVRIMFKRCDVDEDGLINAEDIARFTLLSSPPRRAEIDSAELGEACALFAAQIDAFKQAFSDDAVSENGRLTLPQFAAMQRPMFDSSRSSET